MLTKASLFLLPLAPAMVSAGLLPRWLALDRRNDICGVNGYDRNQGNYFWSASKNLASYSGCSARCAESDRCESFGFNNQVCMLFDLSLAENFDEDRHSDVKYYDIGCIQEQDSTSPSNDTSTTLTRTTTISSATRTVTRSIALATGTGAPSRPTNGTGFFPVHRTATANRLPHAPTSASRHGAATPTATTDASADASDSSNSTDDNDNDGILPPNSNTTLSNNGTRVSPFTTFVLDSTTTGTQALSIPLIPSIGNLTIVTNKNPRVKSCGLVNKNHCQQLIKLLHLGAISGDQPSSCVWSCILYLGRLTEWDISPANTLEGLRRVKIVCEILCTAGK